jgi:N-acetylmuramoyl-L-alanine amidase
MVRVLDFSYRRAMATAFAAASLFFVSPAPASATQKNSAKLQAAQSQFARAEEQRASLNSKPLADRTLADYKHVADAFRRVTLITPHAPEVPEALFAVAELNSEMGDRFGRSYYQTAVDAYQFLVREYPASRHCSDALLRAAQLQRNRLGEPALAAGTYERFLKLYPRSSHRREAMEALAELALLQRSNNSDAADSPKTTAVSAARTEEKLREAQPPSAAAFTGIPRVKKISTTVSADSTRVIIELDHKTDYSSARIKNPDRIYFDFHAARLGPGIADRDLRGTGDLLKEVRLAQNAAGVVRVVLEVSGVEDYSASLANNPPQLIVDLYPAKPALRASREGEKSSGTAAPRPAAANGNAAGKESAANRSVSNRKSKAGPPPPDSLPVNNTSLTRSAKKDSARTSAAAPAPPPTRDGQSTLTRTLGLKIGRIVIDAGHGGHDTGTIGPTGLMEKDLCLDLAVRLGKIIEQRLPGAEVVLTRTDDTFVSLERRTEIANEVKADLFISIHANSSQDQGARGIETYYLNLKGTPEAMDVAARENAMASGGVHDLEDLVKKITRTEKIEESREFARDVQDSLSRRVQKTSRSVRNRGVRKAPFVVLIGADMPSILTEISFLSNPSDEQLLRKPEYRQRVADGLYQGVASYLQSLNSVTYNLPSRHPAGRSRSSGVPVEQSRNQQ